MNWPGDFINQVICGDNLAIMKEIPDESIDMVLTSPPYWGLRDYGIGPDQLGLEPTPELYIEHLTEIFNEVKRILKKEGTFWLNMGDTYGGSGQGSQTGYGDYKRQRVIGTMEKSITSKLMPKCVLMTPERLAWSLIQGGWILRNKIIWIKPNSIPSSVKDRYANKYEFVYYFVKSQRNYFDLDSIREPLKKSSLERLKRGVGESQRYVLFPKYGGGGGINKPRMNVKFNLRVKDAIKKRSEAPLLYKASKKEIEKYQYQDTAECNLTGKNPGDIWVIPTASFPYDYCINCKRLLVRSELIFKNKRRYCSSCKKETMSHFSTFPEELCKKAIIPGCPESGIIVDPFCGAGTALFVAKKLRRRFIGIDIKQEYCDMSEKRIEQGVL